MNKINMDKDLLFNSSIVDKKFPEIIDTVVFLLKNSKKNIFAIRQTFKKVLKEIIEVKNVTSSNTLSPEKKIDYILQAFRYKPLSHLPFQRKLNNKEILLFVQTLLYLCANYILLYDPTAWVNYSALFGYSLLEIQYIITSYIITNILNKKKKLSKVKTQSEVAGSTRKIRQQKKTGKARIGSKKAGHLRGGGILHGPTNVKGHLKINRQFKQDALRFALFINRSNLIYCSESYKIKSDKITLLNLEGRVLFLFNKRSISKDILKSLKIKRFDSKDISRLTVDDCMFYDKIIIPRDLWRELLIRIY